MPKYLVSGKDYRDHRVTAAVNAPNADEAVRRFSARGFVDVTLHSDEVIAHLFKPKVLEHLTPRDYLAIGRVSRLGFMWRLVVRLYRAQFWVFVLGIALIVGRRILEVPWDVIDTLAVGMLTSPIVIVLFSELFNPSRKYERAMAYNAWGRWADMLAALPSVRRHISPAVYAFHEAKALAGLGRLDDALEIVRPFADDHKTPAWLYWGQLADVFNAAKKPDRVIECGEKAVEHAPDNVTVLIDLAMSLLRYRRDTVRARELLDRAREHAISDVLRPFLIMAEGVLALEEKHPERARPLLEEAIIEAQRFRNASPLVGSAIDRMHTYLALACAALGDHAAAEEHYRIAEPRLRAFDATDMIDRCEAVLGKR
jgi:tetratricopeptide (TPR) repeat protein